MLSELHSIRARFIALIITGLLLAPLAGLASALLFGLLTPAELHNRGTLTILAAFIGSMACWAYVHFSRYFKPLAESLRHRPLTGDMPAPQQRQLARFSRDYWSYFLLYALATPPLLFLVAQKPFTTSLNQFLQLTLEVLAGAEGVDLLE